MIDLNRKQRLLIALIERGAADPSLVAADLRALIYVASKLFSLSNSVEISFVKMSRELGIHRSSCIRALGKLEQLGYVKRYAAHDGVTVNRYSVVLVRDSA